MSHEEGQLLINRNIEEELKESYLRYSMSVIISRALPDVRDGLKPSQRRILFAMRQLGLTPTGKHRKCAKICGDTSGDFHPHGESVVYPTLVRMAQDWMMRYPLVNGQGNFGSIDGDPPAAMRYTEARLTGSSIALMEDLDKETVDYVSNYDETKKEPVVFPSKFPNLLSNGSSGIAVGMATNIPPHHLGELIAVVTHLLDEPEATIDDLLVHMPGPDFPTGGIISGYRGIKEAYHTGRGKLTLRGVLHVEDGENDRQRIVIDELPYNVNKALLIERIADLINEKTFTGIADLRDESDKHGIRVVLDLKRNEITDVIINQLYKFTDLEITFGCIMLALDGGMPKVMNLKQMVSAWIDHRIEVIRRRTLFELKKAEARAHIVEGYLKALDHLDAIVKLIRASADRASARSELVLRFEFTERQAEAILDLRLYQLTGMERGKLEDEYKELLAKIERFRAILADEKLVRGVIKDELSEIAKIEKTGRRTRILPAEGELQMEDLIQDEEVVITFSEDDYVKRMPVATFREQRRGGVGVIGIDTSKKDQDTLKTIYVASTHDCLLIFTSLGRCHWLKVWQIPEASRRSKGRPVVNLIEGLMAGEKITAIVKVRNFDEAGTYLLFATKNGLVKKSELSQYGSPRRKGIYGIDLEEGDEVIAVRLCREEDQVMLFTRQGMAVRFNQSLVRSMGRVARGVKGVVIKDADDRVMSCEVVSPENTLLVVCENGFGKRSNVDVFRQTNRGGKGVRAIMTTKRNGLLLAALKVTDEDSLLLMSASGQTLRTSMKDIRVMSRSTQGVKLVQLAADDYLVAAQKIDQGTESEPAAE